MRGSGNILAFALCAIVIVVAVLVAQQWAPQSIAVLFATYTGLLVGMSAGLFGAAFSMLMQSQRRVSQGTLEDIEAAAEPHALAIRGAFGVGAATIVYFFMDSGLLEGSLWPRLNNLGFQHVANNPSFRVPNRDLCLLVIWCFIAGFSETLVPNMLVRTEKIERIPRNDVDGPPAAKDRPDADIFAAQFASHSGAVRQSRISGIRWR